jgi:hypothetical protein
MTGSFMAVPVPAIPPQPPQLTLLDSAIVPKDVGDGAVFQVADSQLAMLPSELRAELEARRLSGGQELWVRGFTYAPENHYPAEIRDRCDFTGVDLPALPAPLGLALTPSTTGGTLAAGTYQYQVTAVNANGETTALAAVTTTTTGTTGSVALTWDKVNETASYRIYGRVAGSMGLIGTAGPFDDNQAATYTDPGTPAPGAAVPGSNTTGGIGTYTNLPINTVVPYLIVAEDWCSAFGFEERDFKGRASRLLENAKHQAIEREFWTGALAQAKGYPNRYLADANAQDLTPGAGPPSVARGMQILQDALQQNGFGGQGMIHVQAQTAPNLLGARRVGKLLLDIFDNIVVPGVGYPGTGPAGAIPAVGTAWMFATDLVMAREESEPTVFPDSFAEAMDWGQAGSPNTIRFRAMKHAAAYFDGAAQYAVRVTLAT